MTGDSKCTCFQKQCSSPRPPGHLKHSDCLFSFKTLHDDVQGETLLPGQKYKERPEKSKVKSIRKRKSCPGLFGSGDDAVACGGGGGSQATIQPCHDFPQWPPFASVRSSVRSVVTQKASKAPGGSPQSPSARQRQAGRQQSGGGRRHRPTQFLGSESRGIH